MTNCKTTKVIKASMHFNVGGGEIAQLVRVGDRGTNPGHCYNI